MKTSTWPIRQPSCPENARRSIPIKPFGHVFKGPGDIYIYVKISLREWFLLGFPLNTNSKYPRTYMHIQCYYYIYIYIYIYRNRESREWASRKVPRSLDTNKTLFGSNLSRRSRTSSFGLLPGFAHLDWLFLKKSWFPTCVHAHTHTYIYIYTHIDIYIYYVCVYIYILQSCVMFRMGTQPCKSLVNILFTCFSGSHFHWRGFTLTSHN